MDFALEGPKSKTKGHFINESRILFFHLLKVPF